MPIIAYDRTLVMLLNPDRTRTVFGNLMPGPDRVDAICAECLRWTYGHYVEPLFRAAV